MTACYVFSTVTPKPTCNLDEFKRLMSQLTTESLSEEHCLLYQVLQTAEDSNIYYVLSKFRDLQALEAHEQSASRMAFMNQFREQTKSDMIQKIANDATNQEDDSVVVNESSLQRVGNLRLVVTVTVFDEPKFIALAQRLAIATRKEAGNITYTFAKVTETVEASINKGIKAGPAETMEYMFIELFQGEWCDVCLFTR